jgi:hypothetical protein
MASVQVCHITLLQKNKFLAGVFDGNWNNINKYSQLSIIWGNGVKTKAVKTWYKMDLM